MAEPISVLIEQITTIVERTVTVGRKKQAIILRFQDQIVVNLKQEPKCGYTQALRIIVRNLRAKKDDLLVSVDIKSHTTRVVCGQEILQPQILITPDWQQIKALPPIIRDFGDASTSGTAWSS